MLHSSFRQVSRRFSHYQIGMFSDTVFDAMPQCEQHNLSTFTSSKLHGGNEIAITCHEGDDVDVFFERETRHIKADTHIYAFLIDVRLQVVDGVQRDGKLLGWLVALHGLDAVLPALQAQLTKAHGEEGQLSQGFVQCGVVTGQGRFAEINNRAIWFGDFPLQWQGVVKVDPVEVHALQMRMASDFVHQVIDLLGVDGRSSGRAELVLDETRIEENGEGAIHAGTSKFRAIKRPPVGSGQKPRLYRHPKSSRFLRLILRSQLRTSKCYLQLALGISSHERAWWKASMEVPHAA